MNTLRTSHSYWLKSWVFELITDLWNTNQLKVVMIWAFGCYCFLFLRFILMSHVMWCPVFLLWMSWLVSPVPDEPPVYLILSLSLCQLVCFVIITVLLILFPELLVCSCFGTNSLFLSVLLLSFWALKLTFCSVTCLPLCVQHLVSSCVTHHKGQIKSCSWALKMSQDLHQLVTELQNSQLKWPWGEMV